MGAFRFTFARLDFGFIGHGPNLPFHALWPLRERNSCKNTKSIGILHDVLHLYDVPDRLLEMSTTRRHRSDQNKHITPSNQDQKDLFLSTPWPAQLRRNLNFFFLKIKAINKLTAVFESFSLRTFLSFLKRTRVLYLASFSFVRLWLDFNISTVKEWLACQ